MLSHNKEETTFEQTNEVYQNFKNQLTAKLESYKKGVDDFRIEVKGQNEFKEIMTDLDNYHNEALTELTKFSSIPIDATTQYGNLLQEEKKAIDQLIQKKEPKISACFSEGLSEALKFSIREYNHQTSDPLPDSIKLSVVNYEAQLKKSNLPYVQLTEFINKIFSELYSAFHTHPFVETMVNKLNALLQNKFVIEKDTVFEISGGTFNPRKLTWRQSGQDVFKEKWLNQETKVIENIYKKRKEIFTQETCSTLKEKFDGICKKITFSHSFLTSTKKEVTEAKERRKKRAQEYQQTRELIFEKIVPIINSETEFLRKKKEHNLFKTNPKDKADRIDNAVRVALENFDTIFKDQHNDEDVIKQFFQFKKDPTKSSIKEALEEKRSSYMTTHMYERIQKKIETLLSDLRCTLTLSS